MIVIGSGFAGLSAATNMAHAGWQVTVLEKHATPGGRARQFSAAGFTFDMGPSWYWMPDVFERYFQRFGKNISNCYTLTRLDPSYAVYGENTRLDIPADYEALRLLFEKIEPGAAKQLDRFLLEAADKYHIGMGKLVYKPGLSVFEFFDPFIWKEIFRLSVFSSHKKHVAGFFRNGTIRKILEFPVLFLGALSENTPALYSLMNFADIRGGTWYPMGGMYKIIDAMYALALEKGVRFCFDEEVQSIEIAGKRTSKIVTAKNTYTPDVVISGADYHYTESVLLPEAYRSYTENWWNSRTMAPSCLIFYVGLSRKIPGLRHHSLFFDVPFEQHAREIYTQPAWPAQPLFYLGAPSVTDESVAPPGGENLFFLIPVASGLKGDTEELREKYFSLVLKRLEKQTGEELASAVVYKRSFGPSDFSGDYHAFKGNAYGLANTLNQTALLKPSCRSKKVKNLFYTGQLTVPGPGVPPSLISGEIVAAEVLKNFC